MADNQPEKLVDLLPDSVEQMRATEGNPVAAMDGYFNQLYTEAGESIGWYYRNKRRPALWARVFRWTAILLSVAGGLYPIWRGILGVPTLGDLGYALLATAAALIAVDRFGGLSSAWMRYITTAQALTREQRTFLLDWREARTALDHSADKPKFEELKPLFKLLRDFAVRHDDIVDAETRTWISEFRSVLAELGRAPKKDEAVQAQSETQRRGVTAAQTPAAAGGIGPKLPVQDAGDGKGAASNIVLTDTLTPVETKVEE